MLFIFLYIRSRPRHMLNTCVRSRFRKFYRSKTLEGDIIPFIKKHIKENCFKLQLQEKSRRERSHKWALIFHTESVLSWNTILYYILMFSLQQPHGDIAPVASLISMFRIRFSYLHMGGCGIARLDFNLVIALLKFDPIIFFTFCSFSLNMFTVPQLYIPYTLHRPESLQAL